ncbi:MAG: hypothetical protein O2805_12770 [Proteobacteria bacterium]|nr:hypothetical protein [Pseudomonadota bacterium]
MPSIKYKRNLMGLSFALLSIVHFSAEAAICNVNVFEAYKIARTKGLTFICSTNTPGTKAGFFPDAKNKTIGCTIKHHNPLPTRVYGRFFRSLKNGWKIADVKVYGYGSAWARQKDKYVEIVSDIKPNSSSTIRMSSLSLRKDSATSCKDVNTAFGG